MPTSPRAKDILMTQSDWKSVHTETKANFRCSVIAYKVSGKTRVSPPDNMNRVDASWKCFPVSQTVFTKYVRKQWKSFTNLICYIIWCILTELKRWWIFWLLRVEKSQRKSKLVTKIVPVFFSSTRCHSFFRCNDKLSLLNSSWVSSQRAPH